MQSHLFVGIVAVSFLSAMAAASAQDGENKRLRHERARHERVHHHERLTPAQREFERTRAESYDPTGSYSAYPDWARYALSPKNGGSR